MALPALRSVPSARTARTSDDGHAEGPPSDREWVGAVEDGPCHEGDTRDEREVSQREGVAAHRRHHVVESLAGQREQGADHEDVDDEPAEAGHEARIGPLEVDQAIGIGA